MTKQDYGWILGLGIGTILFYLLFGGQLPITDPVESNYTLTAQNMVEAKSYFTPLIYHHPWFDKPIWTYWMLVLSFKWLGYNDLAARLPGIIASGFSVSSMYYIVRRISGYQAIARWSAIILATTLEFWYLGHAVVTDMWLFLATLWCFGFAYEGLEQHKHSSMCIAYGAAALAVLVKGPVGVVLPGLILLVYVALRRDTTMWRYLFSWKGILTFLLVALPWYVYMYLTIGDDFIRGFLGVHNYMRATVSEHPKFDVWYYYIINIIIAMLPWTALTLRGIRLNWRRIRQGRGMALEHSSSPEDLSGKSHESLYLMLIFGIVFLFYTAVQTKYPTYTFPVLIPLSIMTAQGLLEAQTALTSGRRRLWAVIGTVTGLLILLLLAAYRFQVVPYYLWWACVAVVVIVLWMVWQQRSKATILTGTIVSALLLYGAIAHDVTTVMAQQSKAALATYIEKTSDRIYVYRNFFTSLEYYSQKDIIQLNKDNSWKDDPWSAAKRVMPQATDDELFNTLDGKTPVIIIVEQRKLQDFHENPLYKRSIFMGQVQNMYIFQVQ